MGVIDEFAIRSTYDDRDIRFEFSENPKEGKMIKPRRLRKGDTIGIVSPASGIFQRSDLWQAVEVLESWGFRVKLGKHVYEHRYCLAGPDEHRAEDLNAFFADDTVDAIFCSRGGYGSARILNDIRYDIIKSNPKIFLGYSDITALHLAIHKMTGLITFHGPVALGLSPGQITKYRTEYLFKALTCSRPIGDIEMADPAKPLVKVAPGIAAGKTIGGNLTLICSTLGTPYEIDTRGKILFWEDVHEEPRRIDAMLTQLLNAGKLQEAAGVVIGECKDCEPKDPKMNQPSTEDVIFDRIAPLGIPAILGLPIGHTRDQATIPVGVHAILDATNGRFRIEEAATT
jgi:muramoyltetrapeptide carboxypeptidase